jgi:HlyD family secretion protein
MKLKIRPARLVLWGAAAALLAAIAWAFRPQPVPVDLALVSRGDLRVTVDDEGMTRVRERYVVSAPVAGRLQRVELEPGDRVEGNRTILATFLPMTPTPLDPRMRAETEARLKAVQATRDQSRVAVQRARDELAFARSEFARQQKLVIGGAASQQQLATLEFDVRAKESQLKAAELAVQTADYELAATRAFLQQVSDAPARSGAGTLTLRSPISGVVLRLLQESETQVPAGTPLIEVGEVGTPDHLEIVSDLLSTDAVKVRAGMPVLIDGWGGETTLCGRVRLVEPAGFTKISALGVEEQRVNVLVDFDAPQGHRHKLGDGYRVDVSIIIVERNGVLKVPTSALFRDGDDWSVFAVRDGGAARSTVQIGERNALEAELLSGLAEGDRVIVHPGETVQDGVAVIPR